MKINGWVLLGLLLCSHNSFAQTVATQTSETSANEENTWKTIRKNLTLVYWSMFTGPSLNSGLGSSTNGTNDVARDNYYMSLNTGYAVTPSTTVGIVNRFNLDFALPEGDDQSGKTSFAISNPRAYVQFNNVIDNSWANLWIRNLAEIPATAAAQENDMRLGLISVQNFGFKLPPGSRWSLGVAIGEWAYFYGDDTGKPTFELHAMPSFDYKLTQKWSFGGWAWFQAYHNGGPAYLSDMYSTLSDNYIRLGPTYTPNNHIQIMPCAQVYLPNAKLNTTTVGFDFSAFL